MNKKIFVIGFNKTATCSFHALFELLGINSVHTDIPVMEIIDDYDAFTDGYHHLKFTDYFNKYPDSLFILNTRPIKNWLISRYKHALTEDWRDCWCWPVSEKLTNEWINEREYHFQNVLEFFKDKSNQLIILNIERSGWENFVVDFLQKKYHGDDVKIIENKTNESKIPSEYIYLIKSNINKCLNDNDYDENEILFKGVNMNKYDYETFL
jgi:hypothetical protein